MSNIIDYIKWRGDLSFSVSPFCEVDNVILSMLSFVDFSSAVSESQYGMPVRLNKCFDENRIKYPNGEDFGSVVPPMVNDLFVAAAQSVRFSEIYVAAYRCRTDEKEGVQFSAVTFVLPDDSIFVAYRGTDDTIVGWREDFCLSFSHPVPAQAYAAEYLRDVASVYRGNIRTGGHSKGGNLAVYSAVFASEEIRQRVIRAYSNDGPGFVDEIVLSPEFKAMDKKILTIAPQSSVIGMLLGRSSELEVTESTAKNGLMQHNPFTWQVMGRELVHLSAMSPRGKRHDEVLHKWLGKLPPEKKREFTDIFFGVLESTGAKTVSDLTREQLPKLLAASRTLGNLGKEEREVVYELTRGLFDAMKK